MKQYTIDNDGIIPHAPISECGIFIGVLEARKIYVCKPPVCAIPVSPPHPVLQPGEVPDLQHARALEGSIHQLEGLFLP